VFQGESGHVTQAEILVDTEVGKAALEGSFFSVHFLIDAKMNLVRE